MIDTYLLEHLGEATTAAQALVHNRTAQDPAEWLHESQLRITATTGPYPDLHWSNAALVDYRRTYLIVVRPPTGMYQLLLSGQTWSWKTALDTWKSAYLSPKREVVEKGTPGATYHRFTNPFETGAMSTWLATLHETCLQYSLEGTVEEEVITILRSKPWLHPRKK